MRVGFLKEARLRPRHEFGVDFVGGVAAGENDLQIGTVGQQAFGEVHAGNASGHHHVGEDKVDFVHVQIPNVERFLAGRRLDDFVAAAFEYVARHLAQNLLVLDDEDCFVAACDRCRLGGFLFCGRNYFRDDGRK